MKSKWVEVGATGPDGHEVFKMRVCGRCDCPVDVCQCAEQDEIKRLIDSDMEWEHRQS